MATQFSVTVRNARLAAIVTAIGPSPTLKIRTGTVPGSTAAADSGTVLASATLPTTWAATPSGGSMAKSGTWSDVAADAGGTAGHYRLYDSGGTCHIQGTVTAGGGGGDMTLDTVTVTLGQPVVVTAYTLTDANQ